MALKIRLARAGSKKRPVYRVVVTDSRNPRDGKFIEKLGTHNPLLENSNSNRFVVNHDRVKYWLSVGAVASDRVNKHLAGLGLQDLYPRADRPGKSQPKKKAQERLAAQAEKLKAAEEAAAAAKAEAESASAQPTEVDVTAEIVQEEVTPETLENEPDTGSISEEETTDTPESE